MAQRGAVHVVYLAGAPSGHSVVERFKDSYLAHRAGAEHDLTVVFNGFSGRADPRLRPWQRALEGCVYTPFVPDEPVLDLGAYRLVATRLESGLCCFLNSFSEIRGADWLGHLCTAASARGVGLVGTSGSWGSMRSYVRFALGLRGPYARVFADRAQTRSVLAGLAAQGGAPEAVSVQRRGLAHYVTSAQGLLEQTVGYRPFPATHVRTTGFMVDRDVFAELPIGSPVLKAQAYRLESGSRGITAMVRRNGLEVRVVARDGRAYAPEEWPESRTFWQGEQENLLIADKQTVQYEQATGLERSVLSRYAWGTRALPSPPP